MNFPEKKRKIEKILIDPGKAAIQNNAYCYLEGDRRPSAENGEGLFVYVQNVIRKYGRLYNIIRRIVAPACYSPRYYQEYKDILKKYGEESIVINLGSGPDYIRSRKDMINVDIYTFDEVDICASAAELPIRDNSVDMVFAIGLMEHVEDPIRVVHEIKRVLKVGGETFIYVPFLYPYHGAPSDYQRWTIRGTEVLFSSFDSAITRAAAGPTSSMLPILQEWMATILSFRSKMIHDITLMILMTLTFPIKYIDKLICDNPTCLSPGGFFVIARK